MIRVTSTLKLYVAGRRVHHGLAGVLLAVIGLALGKPRWVRLGAALIAEDAHDFPWRLRDLAPTT